MQKLFLLRNSDTNVTVVFPNLIFEDLLRVMQYIYVGEITLEESKLDGFMFAIDLLQIQGITPETPIFESSPKDETRSSDLSKSNNSSIESSSNSDSTDVSDSEETTSKHIPQKVSRSQARSDHQGKRTKQLKSQNDDEIKTLHKKDNMLKTEKHRCSFCQNVFKTRSNANQHQKCCPKNPNRIFFHCRKCPRKFSRNCRLNSHFEKTHKSSEPSNALNFKAR